MKEYDIMGHEFMGEVVEAGSGVRKIKKGDRVVIPFPISCGACHYCSTGFSSACDNSNPNAGQQEEMLGQTGAALYGYSHMFGGYDGGQAEYARVPFADANAFVVSTDIPDEKLLFLVGVFAALNQMGIAPEIVYGIFYAMLAIIVCVTVVAVGEAGIVPLRTWWQVALDVPSR